MLLNTDIKSVPLLIPYYPYIYLHTLINTYLKISKFNPDICLPRYMQIFSILYFKPNMKLYIILNNEFSNNIDKI